MEALWPRLNQTKYMRPYLYLFALLLFSSIVTAQIQRGDQLIGLNPGGGLVAPYPSDLGGLSVYDNPYTDRTEAVLDLGLNYGYAVLDRLVVGANVGLGVAYADGMSGSYRLDPFARYYFLNQPKLGVFGQVGTRIWGGREYSSAFEQLDLQAGVQLPIAAGLLLTPAVEYSVQEGRNYLSVGAGLELLLRARTEGESPTPSFGKGTIVLGAQSASFLRRRRILQGGFTVGGQYFLTDQFAAGVQLGLGFYRVKSADFLGSVRDAYGGLSVDVGLSGRYYLTTARRLVWFVDGGAGYVRNWTTSNVSLDTQTTADGYLSVGGGAQYFIRNNVALEVAPQFRYNLQGDGLNPRTSQGINFGFRVLL